MSDFGWYRPGFLNWLGLHHAAAANGKAKKVEIAEAGIDPRTGGAIAVTTKAELDGRDGIRTLKTYYWRMLPNGEQLSQPLLDVEFEQGEITEPAADGTMHTSPTLLPRTVWVLGRKLYDAADEDNSLHELGGHDTVDGVMHNLSCAMMAVGDINRALRDGKLPEVARIFDECRVRDAAGESLPIVGQSPNGEFDFRAVNPNAATANDELTVPATVARALMGMGINTLDAHQRLIPEINTQFYDTTQRKDASQPNRHYKYQAQVDEGKNPKVAIAVGAASLGAAQAKPVIPRMINAAWETDATGKLCTLKNVNLCGEDLTGEQHLLRMQALGVVNRDLHALRKNGTYPPTKDHLHEYGLRHLVQQFEPPPPLAEGGRMTMVSAGGNNMEEIADGFGEAIGGNSKIVIHEGLDDKGKIDKIGVIIDLGLHLSPKDEVNISAAPDVIEHLKYCNDILITHRHLDHTDGLFAYIQYGYLKGKTVHATPEVIRAIRDKLVTYPGIRKEDLPRFAELNGQGWLHVKDKQGDTRLSVNYARNATPHSARTTPFFVHAHYKGKWLGSYLNHGDARYGRHNAEDYDGKPVGPDHLDKDFFTKPNERLLKEVPGLDPSIAHRRATYFDMDITSILKKGWAPTEHEVEDNLVEISDWFQDKGQGFKDKGMLLAMISTNDNRYETALRVATRAHRDLTEFGTNLVKTATTMNTLGVNDLRHEPLPRNNTQPYLDQCFEQDLQAKIARQKAKINASSGEDRKEIERKLARNEARLSAFQILKAMPNQFQRYKKRAELEAALKEQFGRSARLGSIAGEELLHDDEDSDDEHKLGSMRVGRTSKTARAIMGMEQHNLSPEPDGRRLALLTGTQNTNAEVDAALVGLSEGRNSTLDGNPENNRLARPIIPSDNVVVISQSAIPGNNGKQNDMVRKLVKRGFMVVQAGHNGFTLHNIDSKKRLDYITDRLDKLGKSYTIEEDGSLVVTGMPIHAGGHGHEKDCEAWVNLVQADVTAAQHTSDPQGGKRHAELCHKAGLRYMDRVVPNFEGQSINAYDSPATAEITSIGKTFASLIRIETIRQQRNYHSGHLKAQQMINTESEGGIGSDGLRATAQSGGYYVRAFATKDAESAAAASAARVGKRPEPISENRMAPPGERPDRGPILPGEGFRGRYFNRTGPQSAGFVRRG